MTGKFALWGVAMALVAIGGAGLAQASLHLQPSDFDGKRQALLRHDSSDPAEGTVLFSVVQVFYPGLSERAACRVRIDVTNQSKVRVNLNALLATFMDDDSTVDRWLVPTGDMEPGDMVSRTFSCREATNLEVDRNSPYGWPHVCVVNGESRSPCPLDLQISSSLNIATDAPAKDPVEKPRGAE